MMHLPTKTNLRNINTDCHGKSIKTFYIDVFSLHFHIYQVCSAHHTVNIMFEWLNRILGIHTKGRAIR